MRKNPTTRFLEKINKINGCWIWTGYRIAKGYGRIDINRQTILAHRLSYILNKGEIPKGMRVLHRCDNPPCVNPSHLFLGTPADNVHDMYRKHRDNHPHGEKHTNAKLTEEQVFFIRKHYDRKKHNGVQLARQFNVHHSLIYYITNRQLWKHLIRPIGSCI